MSSTAMFWAERGTWNTDTRQWVRFDGTRSPFQSIPEGFYWSITTLATVGYGDVVPITGSPMVAVADVSDWEVYSVVDNVFIDSYHRITDVNHWIQFHGRMAAVSAGDIAAKNAQESTEATPCDELQTNQNGTSRQFVGAKRDHAPSDRRDAGKAK
jgi:hypothetical protein